MKPSRSALSSARTTGTISRSLLHSACALALLLIFLLPTSVMAWHFAFGTISWTVAQSSTSTYGVPQNYYSLSFQQGWNSSWYWCSSSLVKSPSPCVGLAISVGNQIVTGNGGSGNVLYLNDLTGDGVQDYLSVTTQPLVSTVTKLFPLDVVFQASGSLLVGPVPWNHTLQVVFSMCCRVDYLYYPNGGGSVNAFVTATIVPQVPYSFNTTNPPRTYAYANESVPFAITLSALRPSQTVKYSFSSVDISGLLSTAPPGMSLNSSTGVVTWTTPLVGVFAVQFSITDVDTGFYIVLDTLIQTFPLTLHPIFAPLPASWQFTTSQEGMYTVVCTEADPNRQITLTVAGGPATASFSLYSTLVSATSITVTYAFRWTPGANEYSSAVCFQGYDDLGFFNSGNLCVTLLVSVGNLLVLSGTIRDFHNAASGLALLPDFNNFPGGDYNVDFVVPTIADNAVNRVPIFDIAVNTTTTNATHFVEWWNTDPNDVVNMAESFFLLLSNGSQTSSNADPRVYTYSTSAFWPIDNQLFGNENDAHNRYFTLELHSYITYTGGEQLQFQSNDDLWVFINGELPSGWDMQGIRNGPPRSFSISLDSLFNRTTQMNQTFPVDIFYAHRSAVNNAALQVQLVAASLCNALSSGVLQIAFGSLYSAAAGNAVAPSVYLQGQSSLLSTAQGTVLQLLPSNAPYSVGIAYFGDATGPTRLKISHGFLMRFSFIGGGSTDGFTVIFQADSPFVWGGPAGNLGYAGSTGITNSIAIEFDGMQTNGDADPSYNHVSVHTRWGDPNSAVEPGLGGIYSGPTPVFTFFNGSIFDVSILYTAPIDGSGEQTGQMQITFAGIDEPILVAPVDAVMLEQIWQGSAYVGFTSGSGSTIYNSITILNVTLIAIPPSAANSYVPAGGAPTPTSSCQAGQSVQVILQLRDSCGNDLTIGGDASGVQGQMIDGTQTTINGQVTDNNDGTYTITFVPYKIGQYTITITYTGLAIGTSPFSYAVTPGTPSAANSFFNLTFLPLPLNLPHINENMLMLSITTRDSWNNNVVYGRDVYTITFVPNIMFPSVYPQPAWDAVSQTYQANLTANLAVSSQMYIMLSSSDQSQVSNIAQSSDCAMHIPFPLTFLPGPASALTSTLQSSSSLSGSVAGQQQQFAVTLRDAQSNLIVINQSDSVSYLLSSDATAMSINGACTWSDISRNSVCEYILFVAGTYRLNVIVNGLNIGGSSPSATLTISAGPVDARFCVLTAYDVTSGSQLSLRSLQVPPNASIQFLVTMYDSYSNLQTQGLNAGVVNSSDASFAIASQPSSSMLVTAFAPSSNLYTSTATVSSALAGTYIISIMLGGVSVQGVPCSVTVVPGPASQFSYLSARSPSIVVVGQNVSFVLTSVDSSNNSRVTGGSASDFSVHIISNTAVTEVVLNDSSNQYFPFSFSSTNALNMTLSVQVRSSGASIIGSPWIIGFIPTLTDPQACSAQGSGYTQGVSNTIASFYILDRDYYGNAQWPWLHASSFRIAISTSPSDLLFYYSNISSSVIGTYQASYTVPALNATVTEYNVSVDWLDSGNFTWVPIGTAPSTAQILPSNTSLTTSISGPDYPVAQIGQLNTWYIIDTSESLPAPSLSVAIYSTDGLVNILLTAPALSVDINNYSLVFTPTFQLPSPKGVQFFVNVSRSGIASLSSPANVSFIPGIPSAPNSQASISSATSPTIAGDSILMDITLYDSFNNQISEMVSSEVTGIMTCSFISLTTGIEDSASLFSNSTWNSTSSRYTVSFVPTVACFYSFSALLGPALIGGRAYSLNVVASTPNAANSSVNGIDNLLIIASTAGFPVLLQLVISDRFGNGIDPTFCSTNLSASVAVDLWDDSGTMARVGPLVYSNSLGRFSVQIIPFRATVIDPQQYWSLHVTLSGQAVTNSPLQLSVTPASVYAATLTGSLNVTAGLPIIANLTMVDSFGNMIAPAFVASLPLTAYVTNPQNSQTATPLGSHLSGSTFVVQSSQFGLEFFSTELAGSYSISFRAFNALVPAQLNVSVEPGSLDVTQSTSSLLLSTVQAGSVNNLTMHLKDSYGNIISNPHAVALISLSIFTWSGTFTCGMSMDTHEVLYPTEISNEFYNVTSVTFDPKSQHFVLLYSITVVGTFTSNLTLNGTNMPCTTLLPALVQTISPASPSVLTSYISGLPMAGSFFTAGNSFVTTLQLLDQYGNPAAMGTYAVCTTQNYSSILGNVPNTVLTDTSRWQLGVFSSLISDHAGRYFITVTPTNAGWVSLVVLLNGYVIQSAMLVNASLQLVSPTFEVIPSAPSEVVVAQQSNLFVAGRPFTISFLIADAYGNAIVAQNEWYQLQWNVYGQTLSPAEYTFKGSLSVHNVSAMVSGAQQDVQALQWSTIAAWSGAALIQIQISTLNTSLASSLSIPSSQVSSVVPVFINGSECSVDHPQLPWRCADGTCSSSYNACSVVTNILCPSDAPVLCYGSNVCVGNGYECPCPANFTRCAVGGQCVLDESDQCPPSMPCPNGLVACMRHGVPSGDCRADAASCPSFGMCPPTYALCPDLITCASPAQNCSDYSTLVAEGVFKLYSPGSIAAFRCADGKLVQSTGDCSTPQTCPANTVLCLTDGKCHDNSFICPALTPSCFEGDFRCSDGTCITLFSNETSFDDMVLQCPTSISCPVGYTHCTDGSCTTSVQNCPSVQSTCALDQVTCRDGSCRASLLLCPTRVTCPPLRPVQCSDGSCVETLQYCTSLAICPVDSVRCPDGSCVQGNASCSVTVSCPGAQPVLCEDRITCSSSVATCATALRCLAPNVIHCGDGSCRRDVGDCPTQRSCPSSQPVRCTDGYTCAFAAPLCPPIQPCPTQSPIRCGGGECVASLALCPTHVTCTPGTSRCADGSCQFACPTLVSLTCPVGLVACPHPSAGVQCVPSLTQCATQVICTSATPVRCVDATCAISLSSCPVLTIDPPSNLLPCADGSWTADVTTCGTLASCPTAFPYKCLDDTCRLSPIDCPEPLSCGNSTFRCANSVCVPQLTDAQCQSNSIVPCSVVNPIKCPGAGEVCVAKIEQCNLPALYLSLDATFSSAVSIASPSLCPSGFIQCRAGNCVLEISSCAVSSCPQYLPIQCANGVCAQNTSACPDPLHGCYPFSATPHSCWNGLCVSDASQCPQVPSSCDYYCPDGSCPPITITDSASAATWCLNNGHSCSLNCADSTCGIQNNDATQTNLCIVPAVLAGFGASSIHTGLGNVCPMWAPYQCDDGRCVASSLNCTSLPDFNQYCQRLNPATPVLCANGDCVTSSLQCPVVYPCPLGTDRCGDASCRSSGSCPAVSNSCPTLSYLTQPLNDGSNRRARCSNGLCSQSLDISGCPDYITGCPPATPNRCSNGACVSDQSLCLELSLSPSGCRPPNSFKCPNGACAVNETNCTLPNNCHSASPFRCSEGDGTCQTSPASCSKVNTSYTATERCIDGSLADSQHSCPASNGCPVLTPWRCVDGSCRKYSASTLLTANSDVDSYCPLSVQCLSASQYLCFDGSCAATSDLCPATPNICTTVEPVLCPDLSCAQDVSFCAPYTTVFSCPPTAAILCNSGACVSSWDQCASYQVPGVSAGGEPFITNSITASIEPAASFLSLTIPAADIGNAVVVPTYTLCPFTTPVTCFDGSCSDSWSTCQQLSINARQSLPVGYNVLNESLDFVCGSGEVMCPNGYCALADCAIDEISCTELACGIISSCSPTIPVRCLDGSCAVNSSACATFNEACLQMSDQDETQSLQHRCEDGSCRSKCLPFDGCPLSLPFQCANRECAVQESGCNAASIASAFQYTSSDFEYVASPYSELLAPANNLATITGAGSCWSSCWAQLKASPLDVQVDVSVSNTLTLLTNGYSIVPSTLLIPAHAMVLFDPNITLTRVSVQPVPESILRLAENRVPSSRQAEFGMYLTFAESVLSPAFNIQLDQNVSSFSLAMQLSSPIDYVSSIDSNDICLAVLHEFPIVSFYYWSCVLTTNEQRLAAPVVTSGFSSASVIASGNVQGSGVYAFVVMPISGTDDNVLSSFIERNLLIIVLCLAGGAASMVTIFYSMKRLHRYRQKYHEERRAVVEKREEVADMELFGPAAISRKYEDVQMTANPMVQQLTALNLADKNANKLAVNSAKESIAAKDELKTKDAELEAKQQDALQQHRERVVRTLREEVLVLSEEADKLQIMLVPSAKNGSHRV